MISYSSSKWTMQVIDIPFKFTQIRMLKYSINKRQYQQTLPSNTATVDWLTSQKTASVQIKSLPGSSLWCSCRPKCYHFFLMFVYKHAMVYHTNVVAITDMTCLKLPSGQQKQPMKHLWKNPTGEIWPLSFLSTTI